MPQKPQNCGILRQVSREFVETVNAEDWVVPNIRLERMTYRLQGGCSTS